MIPTSLEKLLSRRDDLWHHLLERSRFVRGLMAEPFDRRLFGIYLIETYHYVIHNPRHQALVGARSEAMHPNYRKFCFEHAAEETGHELMALHDLHHLGSLQEGSYRLSSALLQTELLNAYLYHVSTTGNPLQRLGYSFWAESAYQYVGNVIARTRQVLELSDAQMTFLVAHASIDEKHAAEVAKTLTSFCTSDDDWHAVAQVMEGSLQLQGNLLDAVWDEFVALRAGEDSRYRYLNVLRPS